MRTHPQVTRSSPRPSPLIAYPAEAAELLGQTSQNTLRYWRRTGYGPRHFRIGKRVAYRVCDIEAWIEERLAADDRGAR